MVKIINNFLTIEDKIPTVKASNAVEVIQLKAAVECVNL